MLLLRCVALLFHVLYSEAHTWIVNTENGPVAGHAAKNRSDVAEFLGIPYATPPVADLRFEPPQKLGKVGYFNASDWVRARVGVVVK